jgi:hypothetical protein
MFTFATVWRNNNELGLLDTLASDWDKFTSDLSQDGITLQEGTVDQLMWIDGDSTTSLTVQNCYKAILSTQQLPMRNGWKANF